MRKNKGYNFLTLFSPLDLVTILYALVSGLYLCFSQATFDTLLPHFAIRVFLLLLIVFLAFSSRKFTANRLLLFFRNLYPLLFLSFFYTETSCMKNIVFHTDLDKYFFNAEQSLWHCQPSIAFSKLMPQEWFSELMNLCYFSYYVLIGLACIALYLSNPGQSAKGVFTVIFSFYMYYIIFDVLPVVGPKYYIPGLSPETSPLHFFGKVMHRIVMDYEKPTGAFPSSHAGIALVIAYITYKHLPKLFLLMLPFIIGICFATVYIKAHYLVDVVAGIISAPVFIILSGKIYNKFLSCGLNKNAESPVLNEIDR